MRVIGQDGNASEIGPDAQWLAPNNPTAPIPEAALRLADRTRQRSIGVNRSSRAAGVASASIAATIARRADLVAQHAEQLRGFQQLGSSESGGVVARRGLTGGRVLRISSDATGLLDKTEVLANDGRLVSQSSFRYTDLPGGLVVRSEVVRKEFAPDGAASRQVSVRITNVTVTPSGAGQ
jgi:hypothetical protein